MILIPHLKRRAVLGRGPAPVVEARLAGCGTRFKAHNLTESDYTYSDPVKTISATELARNLGSVVDRLAVEREEIVIEGNPRQVARLAPGPGRLTALEALADLYRTLPEEAAAGWEADSRGGGLKGERLAGGVRNPWAF